MSKLISEHKYREALVIVDRYHRQQAPAVQGGSIKTRVREWDKLTKCSCRLRNILIANFTEKLATWNYNNEWENMPIEQITRHHLLSCRNAGKKTWDEFKEIRGY